MAETKPEAKGTRPVLAAAVIFLLLTLVGAGVGLVAGSLLQVPPHAAGGSPVEGAQPDRAAASAEAGKPPSVPIAHDGGETAAAPAALPGEEHVTVKAFPFPPVLTTLAEPKGTWIRLEGSMLIDVNAEEKPELLAETAATNMLGYLRTVKLDQIDGPAGLLYFRQDINELVSALSAGQVREVLIHTLVVE